MADTTIRSHFGFIGFGLIGGSIAKALREMYPESDIIAYNYYETKKHPKLEMALADGTLSQIGYRLEELAGCDVLFLCAPVLTNVAYLKRLLPCLNKDCILTDVGSVKGNIHQEIHKLDLDRQFVGGHPMTGSEKTGYEHADPSLLKGAYYLLTTTRDTEAEYTRWMESFVKDLGSICMTMDADAHDQITAGISHGPHLISAALVNTVAHRDKDGNYRKVAAGGFRDITRISSSSPEIWQNICLTNRESIVNFIDEYIEELSKAKEQVMEGNGEALTDFFASARAYRDSFQAKELSVSCKRPNISGQP